MPVRKEAEKVTGVFLTGRGGRELSFRIHRGGYGPEAVVRARGTNTAFVEFAPTITELAELRDALTELLRPYE